MGAHTLVAAVFVLLVTAPGCAPMHDGKEASMTFRITSDAFEQDGPIPQRYTCQGENINPPLRLQGVPRGAASVAIVVDDPDAPAGTWDHWVLWDVDPATESIAERSVPPNAVQGRNGWGASAYGGPCPPSGTHRYVFTAYALDTKMPLPRGASKQDLERAMAGHILAEARLVGTYRKS